MANSNPVSNGSRFLKAPYRGLYYYRDKYSVPSSCFSVLLSIPAAAHGPKSIRQIFFHSCCLHTHQIGNYRLLSFLRTGLSIDMVCCAKWNTHRTPACTPCVRVVNGIKSHRMRKSTRGTSTTISLSVTSQKAIPFTFRFSLSSIPRSGMWCQTASLLPLPPLHMHYLITRMITSEIIDR